MSINDHHLIDKYFLGGLTPDEATLFEEKIARDPLFKEEVEIHRQAFQLIHKEGRQLLKSKLAEKGKTIDKSHRLRIGFGLLGIIFLGIILIYFIGPFQSSIPDEKEHSIMPSITPERKPTLPLTTDTIIDVDRNRPDKQQKNPETLPVPKKAVNQTPDELFAAYYTPFEDESLYSSLRGQDSPAHSDRFIEAYLKGNYTEALSLFENMDSYDQQNDNMLFIKAISLVSKKDYNEAINLLEQIIKRDRTRYMSAANWYLALFYIKTRQLEKAKNQLRSLNQDSTGAYHQKAHVLMKEL